MAKPMATEFFRGSEGSFGTWPCPRGCLWKARELIEKAVITAFLNDDCATTTATQHIEIARTCCLYYRKNSEAFRMYAPFPPEPSAASQIQAGAELLGGRIATDSSECILGMAAFLEPQKLMWHVSAFRHSFRKPATAARDSAGKIP